LQGYSQKDNPLNFIELLNITNRKATFPRRIKSLARGVAGYIAGTNRSHLKNGTVSFLNCDLRNLAEIKDNSVDIVVSVSSLEHNEHISTVKAIVQELERILMPGGRMLITLPAAHKQDWFFVPAYSWCFTDNTIRDIFNFSRDVSSNYSHYEHHFDNIKRSKDLKKNLSWRYFFTRKSGMPLGKWEPKYIPVGIIKIKQV
jgi:ubiquinone/menaquinone biosynthesis C-methylase UbiE